MGTRRKQQQPMPFVQQHIVLAHNKAHGTGNSETLCCKSCRNFLKQIIMCVLTWSVDISSYLHVTSDILTVLHQSSLAKTYFARNRHSKALLNGLVASMRCQTGFVAKYLSFLADLWMLKRHLYSINLLSDHLIDITITLKVIIDYIDYVYGKKCTQLTKIIMLVWLIDWLID